MYHVSLGLLEVGMYGIPVAFICQVFLGGLPAVITLLLGLAGWGGASVWILRRADARFRRDADKPGFAELPTRLQTTVLRYTAIAGGLLLTFTLIPIPLAAIGAPVGLWIEVGSFGLTAFVILLFAATAYSVFGLIPVIRRLYPEYPGFVATLLFALSLFTLFVASVFVI